MLEVQYYTDIKLPVVLCFNVVVNNLIINTFCTMNSYDALTGCYYTILPN